MKRILTLTDFSGVANMAVEVAFNLAVEHSAKLEIYHVLKSADHIMYGLDEKAELTVRNSNNTAIRTKLEEWKQKALKSGVEVNFIIGTGDLIEGVNMILKTRGTDLIIMGSIGIDESDGVWGTTTQHVTKQIEIPVLVIKSEMRDNKLDNIVFASNLNVEDRDAFKRFIDLIKPPSDAIIHFLSVDTTSYFSQPRILMTSVLKDFEELAKPYKSDSTFYSDYSVSSGIEHYLEKVDPDVLVMSNRDRNFLKDLFLPNAAITAVGNVDCPVLILK